MDWLMWQRPEDDEHSFVGFVERFCFVNIFVTQGDIPHGSIKSGKTFLLDNLKFNSKLYTSSPYSHMEMCQILGLNS